MLNRIIRKILIFAVLITIFQATDVQSKSQVFKVIHIENISRYFEERVAFQHIERKPKEYVFDKIDNSIACLLIIKDKKMYLFKDGYDNPEDIIDRKSNLIRENKLIPDMWTNKVDDNPDFIRITHRRVELKKNISQEWVTKNYKDFYIKIRDAFIKKHVAIFKALIINRNESNLFVRKKAIPKKIYDKGPTKYSISVTGKTIDEKVYHAEDADGDGITETFTVQLADGFNWGYKSGPNLLFIYKCSYADKENKPRNQRIKELIGNITKNASEGTPEEEKIIKKTFPQIDTITNMINYLYQIDADSKKLLKDNKIDLEKSIDSSK